MSETVHYKGKLIPTGKTIEQFVGDVEIPSWFEDAEEYLVDAYYETATVIDGVVFTVEKESIDPDGDIFTSSKNEDGSINFELKYYNGGCGFNEAIEYALNTCNKSAVG